MDVKTVLAIDPGSAKCGLALVRREEGGELTLLWHTVCPPEAIPEKLDEARAVELYSMIVIGAGTRSRPVVEKVRDLQPSMGILVVDEKDTTLQARERYWEANPRRGWRRLLPATLFEPREPYDDFAALILAERVLQAT